MRPCRARSFSDGDYTWAIIVRVTGNNFGDHAIFAQQIVNGVMLGAIYAMIGVALTLSIGVLRFLNFSIPGLFMLGGMITWAMIRAGAAWPLAAVAALALGGACSLIIERFTWRWMRTADQFVPLVSSMAFLILFENLAVALWGSDLRTLPRLFGNADWRVGGVVVSVPQLLGLCSSVGLIWGLSLLLSKTRLGRGLRTIAEDSDTALMLGVDVNRIVPSVFIISGLFAALGGVLFALNYRQVQPFMGELLGLKGISAMIIGGMGNIWGAIAGGLVIGLAEVAAIDLFGADVVDIVVYGLLLLILVVRPTGLFGVPQAETRA
jgi:branched-chain amino acid transport system permease protein